MGRVKTFGMAVAAMLLLGALTAGAAAAKPLKLELTWNGEAHQLAPGDHFRMVTHDATIATSPGAVTCTEAESFPAEGFTGVDQTDLEATDKIQLDSVAYGALYGSHACENTSGLGSTAFVYFHPDNATLELAGSKGKATFKRRSTSESIFIDAAYSGGDLCLWEASKMKAALTLPEFNQEPQWKRVDIAVSEAKFKLVKALSAPECAKKATFAADFEFATSSHGEEEWNTFGKLVS